MRAVRILRRLLKVEALATVHVARLKAVFFAVESLIHGGRLSLTAIGRAARGAVRPKHSVKRIDRLLGNRHLHGERLVFARALADLLLTQGRPMILVDWTKLSGKLYALVAAVPFRGRAVPLYVEVHNEKLYGTPKVEKRFLKALAKSIPPGIRPLIVTDAGYRTPWFSAVKALGWDYLGRLQGAVKVCLKGAWRRADRVRVGNKPIDLGQIPAVKTARTTHRVICARPAKKPKRRRQRSKYDRTSLETRRRRAKANWVLATSLQTETAEQLIKLYARRMEIEEMFRDIKSARFGWSLEHARTQSPRRYEVLLLLAALAMLLVLLVGMVGENNDLHYAYQANTTRNRRVLSLVTLGRSIIARGDDLTISYPQLLDLLEDTCRRRL